MKVPSCRLFMRGIQAQTGNPVPLYGSIHHHRTQVYSRYSFNYLMAPNAFVGQYHLPEICLSFSGLKRFFREKGEILFYEVTYNSEGL